MRIVTDSSANIVDYKDMNLGVAPLHIIVGDMDYVDDDMVDIDAMQKKLSSYKGKTSTASQVLRNGNGHLEMMILYSV